jgi:predicted phosphate transport protein (TIGR00153 family)
MAVGARGCSHPPHALASRAVRLAFTPKTTEFYDLFSRAGENVLAVAQLSERRFAQIPDSDVRQREIKQLEHEGDRITREIVELLNTQYITPFDREDIYALASGLDDVMDMMDEVVDLVLLYEVQELPSELSTLVEVIQRCAEITNDAMPRLQAMKDLEEYWIEINRLENAGDKSYRRTLANLFSGGYEALEVLKLKDIVTSLEGAIDAFEKVANIVEQIAVKES